MRIEQNISPERERQLFGSILPETFTDKHGCHDMQAKELLEEIGNNLRRQESDQTPIDFLLLDWEMANAFALPGRKVIVTTGLLRKLENSEQLAAILGHELGHIALRHNLSEFIRASLAGFAWGVLVGDFSGAFVLDPTLMKQAGERALSRDMEREADHFGAELLLSLGHDPRALGTALTAISKAELDEAEEKETIPKQIKRFLDLFSTHPETQQRVDRLLQTYPQTPSREALSLNSWSILKSACAVDLKQEKTENDSKE